MPHRTGRTASLLQRRARASGASRTLDVAVVEPEIAQAVCRQIVAQGTRQHRAVDAARGRAGNDIDDDAQIDDAADLAQQLEVDRLGVVLGAATWDGIEKRGTGTGRTIRDVVQRRGGAHELQDLLADAMHVDGERNAAKADESNAELFFSHRRPLAAERGRYCSNNVF